MTRSRRVASALACASAMLLARPALGAHTFAACGLSNAPNTCADFQDAGRQRDIASRRRPLAGIYSTSARNAESKRHMDLVLSTVRRTCDPGARLDSLIV